MSDNKSQIRINENESEEMSESLLERCDQDVGIAGFFHSLGAALQGKDVNNEHLKSGKYVIKDS